MKPAIVWFRQDLRLADNPALRARGAIRLPPIVDLAGGQGALWLRFEP
jgi:deoxyribodipyrimidine photolyase